MLVVFSRKGVALMNTRLGAHGPSADPGIVVTT